MAIEVLWYFFSNCTRTIFSQKLLYCYYFTPHSGQIQSTKKRDTCQHGHLEMNVLKSFTSKVFRSLLLCVDSIKYAIHKLSFLHMKSETCNWLQSHKMGEWIELIMWRFIFCNRQLWARKWGLANGPNNSLEKISLNILQFFNFFF